MIDDRTDVIDMVPSRVRLARVVFLIVPLLMSTVLVLVFGALIPVVGSAGLFAVMALAAAVARTPVGERAVATCLPGARKPTMFQRYTLSPVAELLLAHSGVPTEYRRLLVIRNGHVVAYGLGRGTILVSTGLIEALARNRLSASEAAALIAHELGVMRAGLTRSEATLAVLLVPWHIWLIVMDTFWNVAKSLLPRPVFRASIVLIWGITLWRGYSEDPRHFVASGLLTLAYATYLGYQWWSRERASVGDLYVYECGLGQPLADILMRSDSDRQTRHRIVRLRTGQFTMRAPGWTDQAAPRLPAWP